LKLHILKHSHFLLWCFALLVVQANLFADTNDSLLSIINSSKSSDSTRVIAIVDLSYAIAEEYPDSAFSLLENVESFYKQKSLPALHAKVLTAKSYFLQNIGKYPEALQLLFEAKKQFESEPGLIDDTLYLSDYVQVISSIGVLFYNTEKHEDALAYFEQGLTYLQGINAKYPDVSFAKEYFRFNLNTGGVYTKIEAFDKAELFFTKALQYLDENDLRSYSMLLNNLSIIARQKGDIDRAFDLNRQAIEVWKRAGIMRGLAQSYNNLGNCYVYINDFANALESFNTALEISRDYGSDKSAIIALEQLSILYDTLGKHKLAYDTHVKYKALSDSVLNLEKIHLVTQLELQEKFDRRMSETRLKQKQLESEQRKRELIYTLIIVLIASGLIIVVLLFYLQSSKSKRLKLETEKSTLLNKSLGLEKTKLEEDLEFKNKELATNVMYMIRKNELISRISEKLIKSKLVFKKENQIIIDEIIRDLKLTTDDDIWTEFEIRFQQVHNDFYNKLNERYPNLSANEKRLCAFLRLNMSTKEISAITHQSINSLTVARSRLRKKLELDSDENLIFFLESL